MLISVIITMNNVFPSIQEERVKNIITTRKLRLNAKLWQYITSKQRQWTVIIAPLPPLILLKRLKRFYNPDKSILFAAAEVLNIVLNNSSVHCRTYT